MLAWLARLVRAQADRLDPRDAVTAAGLLAVTECPCGCGGTRLTLATPDGELDLALSAADAAELGDRLVSVRVRRELAAERR